tara:strand:- start:56 stop:658 length:603 start_codon:yes stop_codon:yes gene_type:complete
MNKKKRIEELERSIGFHRNRLDSLEEQDKSLSGRLLAQSGHIAEMSKRYGITIDDRHLAELDEARLKQNRAIEESELARMMAVQDDGALEAFKLKMSKSRIAEIREEFKKSQVGVEEVYPEEEPGRVAKCCGARWDTCNLRYCPICNETLKSGVKKVNRCPCGAEMKPKTVWEEKKNGHIFQNCANGHAIDMGAFEPVKS